MSKQEFTLIRAHLKILLEQHHEWWVYESNKVGWTDYFTANPLTLEFDVPSPWRTDFENASVCLNNERNHLGIDDFNKVHQVNVHLDTRIFTHFMEIPKLPTI